MIHLSHHQPIENEGVTTVLTIKKIYEGVSIVFSAPFIALYICIRLFLSALINIEELMMSLLLLVAIPLIIPLYYAARWKIDWDYPERKYRVIPFFLVNLGYTALLIYSLTTQNRELVFLSLSYWMNGVIAWFISLGYKVSIHMIGISGPATYMLFTNYAVDAIILYIVGIITAYSRYTLKRHTLYQLILGYSMGILLTITAYYLVYTI